MSYLLFLLGLAIAAVAGFFALAELAALNSVAAGTWAAVAALGCVIFALGSVVDWLARIRREVAARPSGGTWRPE